jgi:hypothetical protein
MDTPTLKRILVEEMQKYTGEGYNDVAYLTVDDVSQVYAIIDMARGRDSRVVSAVLVARLVDTQIIIDLDLHDKLLVDALKAQGVPETQITLAYQNNLLSAS